MNTNNPYGMGALKQDIKQLSQQFISAAYKNMPSKLKDLPHLLHRADAEIELIQTRLFVHTGEVDDIPGDLEDAYRFAEILIRAIGYLETAHKLSKR